MSPVGLKSGTIGGNGASNYLRRGVVVDLHTATNNFAPNKYRGLVNSSGLVVYKGSNARDKKGTSKSKKQKVNSGVNNGVKMDRGPVIFTSDVSLPKDDKKC